MSVGPMSKSKMRSVGQTEILDTSQFIPIARMLEGRDDEEVATAVDALSFAMQLLVRDGNAFQRWMLYPLGGLPALVAFQRERLRQKKRRPFLIARYANLSHRNLDAFSSTVRRYSTRCFLMIRSYSPISFWQRANAEIEFPSVGD